MALFVKFILNPDQGIGMIFGSDPFRRHVRTDTLHLYAPASKAEIMSKTSSINPMT